MTLTEQIMNLQTYKMNEGEDTVYVERDDVIKALEQQPRDCKICIFSRPSDIDFENEIKRALHENLKELDKAALEGNRRDEDAISRQAVLEKAIIVPIAKVVTDDEVICRKIVFVEDIQNLPSVTPSRPKGKWIQTKDDCDGVNFYDFSFECSKCGKEQSFKSNYCPNCGAKMIESEEL